MCTVIYDLIELLKKNSISPCDQGFTQSQGVEDGRFYPSLWGGGLGGGGCVLFLIVRSVFVTHLFSGIPVPNLHEVVLAPGAAAASL